MDELVDLFLSFQSERWLEPVFSIPDFLRLFDQLFSVRARTLSSFLGVKLEAHIDGLGGVGY